MEFIQFNQFEKIQTINTVNNFLTLINGILEIRNRLQISINISIFFVNFNILCIKEYTKNKKLIYFYSHT